MGRGKRRTFGTVFLRGSTFFVQYLDSQGRRVKEKAGGTRGLADRLLAKRREEVETSRVTGERPVRPLGFRELVDRWETVTRGTRREGSLLRDLGALRAGAVPHFGETLVHAIRSADVEGYLAKRQAEDQIAPGTRNKELTRLSVLFDFAVRVGCGRENPCAEVPRAREETPEVPYLEPADRERLLGACPEPLRTLAAFLLVTGLRLGEALRLSWGDVDLAGRRLTVRTSKAGRPRVVGLTSRAVAALEAVRPAEGDILPLAIFGALGSVDRRGEAVLRTPAARAWRAARRRAGLPAFRLHDCRHVAASTMVRAGVALSDVAAVLGHSSLQMVQARYGRHVPASAPVLAAERLERFLSPPPVARAE